VGFSQVGHGGIDVDVVVEDHNVAGDSTRRAKHLAAFQLLH
jgi:hypothetical protein